MPVAKDIDLATAVYVMEHRRTFPEVSVTRTAERRYPNDSTAADVLGYVGPDQRRRARRRTRGEGYRARDTIGKTGVEQMFESELRGKPGKDKVEVDNQGRAVERGRR